MGAPPRIFYTTPFSSAGLGKAYNEYCAIIPNDDDWICIQDFDVMLFCSQDFNGQLEEAIVNHPEFDIFTCVTSRLCLRCQQQVSSKIGTPDCLRDERDIVKLKRAADDIAKQFRGTVEPIRGFFAGYFMAFPKRLWKRFPFPEVGSQGGKILGVDSAWSRTLRQNKIRVGMLRGLMAVHYYRLGEGETDISHLKDPAHNQNRPNGWDRINNGATRHAGMGRPMPLASVPQEYLNPRMAISGPGRIELNPSIRPPGGYKFRDDDGVVHISNDLAGLVRVVAAYRRRVGRPPGDPEQEIILQIYHRHPRCCRRV